MKPMQSLLFSAALMLAGSSAFAHSDEYLDTQKTPNGGQQRMAGIYHFELVVAKDSKEAFLAALHDEDLVISGDFVEVLWFQGFTDYLQPGK